METDFDQGKYLFALSALDIPKAEEGKKRTFKGTAYAGGRVDGHWYWGRTGVVFDLEGIEIPVPTPLLGEHFSTSRIGVVKSVSTSQGIQVEGSFLSNPEAQQFIQDSDDGFPFQMSMFIDPGSIEEFGQGVSVTVNGQTFSGPIAIFRNNRIREFTICSTGADRNTAIKAFSGKPSHQPKQEDTNVTELEKANARIKELEAERDNALKDLQQFKAKQREQDITALETELKVQFSGDDKTAYTNMDDATFTFAAKQLRQFSGKQPESQPAPTTQSVQPNPALAHLFTHQAKSDGNEKQTFSAGSLVDQAKQRK